MLKPALSSSLLLVLGCTSSDPTPQKPADIAPPSTSAAAATTAAAAGVVAAPSAAPAPSTAPSAAPDVGPPVCERSNEKVRGTGVSKLTGLTTKMIDKKLAVGYAVGVEPRVIVIDKAGEVSVLKVKTGAKAASPDPKEGYRNLMRVSPISIKGNEARAFLDYRDDFKDKRRRVACGPADSDESFLSFEGTSYLDMDPKPTGEDKKKLFSWKKLGGYVELRDCRTFVTLRTEETWAIGSVLRGVEKPDGSNEWKMVLLIDFGPRDEEIVLHEANLKGDPPKISNYEIPTSRRVRDKGFVVATRFGGSLMVGVLDESRKLQGKFKTYRGFPTMPDISRSEGDFVLLTGIGAGKEKSLKALVIPQDSLDLPAGYTDIDLEPLAGGEGEEASFSAPELTVDSKGQRWLAYVEGPNGKAHLRVAPLDKDLKPAGRAFSVTEGDVFGSEARLAALDDGRLMITYLRDKAGKTELVTEQLACDLKK
jgi:hypothetical protein